MKCIYPMKIGEKRIKRLRCVEVIAENEEYLQNFLHFAKNERRKKRTGLTRKQK